MNYEEAKNLLRSDEGIEGHEFEILKTVASLAGVEEQSNEARELVLRALERKEHFKQYPAILTALTRAVGLYPYVESEQLDLRDTIAYEFHRPLEMAADFVFHREQADVYHRLLAGESVILSAPTSFGKSRIIDAMIAAGRFRNLAVIVPTLALIDETRRRLATFSGEYKIVTHLGQKPAEKNIFVFTPERASAYGEFPKVEFFAIDEFYKIDAVQEDDSRTVALNLAFQKLLRMGGQFYMLGPNIEKIPDGMEEHYRCTFYPTRFSTVVAEHHRVQVGTDAMDSLVQLCGELDEPTLIFCSSPARVNKVAQALLDADVGAEASDLVHAQQWAAREYHAEWIWGRALVRGIGIHHGRLPRSLAQYTVRMFNDLKLKFLICTSTLIEGVNTKAKNVIVFDNKIARKKFDFFTFNNIKGRSGRMFVHFVGNVYLFADPPQEKLPFVDFPVFTQDERTPDSLLVHLEESELQPAAKSRVQKWADQSALPLSILRDNSTIDPDAQIEVAKQIREGGARAATLLAWSRTPRTEQLRAACELIWEYLAGVKRNRGGVFSAKQLAFKIWQLRRVRSASERVRQELRPGQWSAKSPDEAVERVLLFERTWASFEFPKYLMALSRIQQHVLGEAGHRTGDYSYFASRVECLFLNPVIAALDEYGIPMQVAQRLAPILGTEDDLDQALTNLRGADLAEATGDSFEWELLSDAQDAL